MMPHRNKGGLQWERDQDLGEYMQSWAWFQMCCFLQLVLLTPCLLKLTDRAHCIKFQRCLFSAAKCPKRSSTQLPSSEKDTEPSDCLMVLGRNICFIWSFILPLKPGFDGVRYGMSYFLAGWVIESHYVLIRITWRPIAPVMEPMTHFKILSVLFCLLPKLQSFLWQVAWNSETMDIKIYDLKKLRLFSFL